MSAVASTVSASPAEGVQPLSKIAIHKATVNLHGSALRAGDAGIAWRQPGAGIYSLLFKI
jgi:hypothetical protein